MPTIHVIGRVIDQNTHKAVSGVRVETRGKDLPLTTPAFGSALTDSQGVFRMDLDEVTVFHAFGDNPRNLLFKTSRDGQDIAIATGGSVPITSEHVETTIVVDLPAAPPAPPLPDDRPPEEQAFVVKGTVRQANGNVLVGTYVVQAFDQDLRSEEKLGQPVTYTLKAEDRRTSIDYRIQYTVKEFAKAEYKSADLFVRVFDGSAPGVTAQPKTLATSSVIFNAAPIATVDLVIGGKQYRGPSEFERYLEILEAPLEDVAIAGIAQPTIIDKLADLKKDDIDFLTGETDIERPKIELLIAVALLQKQAFEQHFEIPASVFYGLAREGLSTDLTVLGLRSQQEVAKALEKALDDNIIPAVLRDSLPRFLDQLLRLVVSHTLQSPQADGKPSLGQLLGTSLPSPDKQASLLTAYAAFDGPVEDFWKKLRENPDFNVPGVIEKVQLTLQLGVLTQNHVPLIQELQRQYRVTSTRDLVKLDSAAWTALINKQGDGPSIGVPPDVPGETTQEKTTNYVTGIVSMLQAAFPTDAVAQILAKAPAINVDDPTRQAVTQFFTNASDFELRSTHIDTYVAKNATTVFNGIAEADRPNVVNQVKRLQRVFQVSTSPDTMTALLGSGFDSAHAIAQVPRNAFVGQLKGQVGGEQQALMIYDRAQSIHAAALHVYTRISQALNDAHPLVVGDVAEEVKALVSQRFPNYTDLFGSLDLCACEHCRSVYSPAAYFVDLLHFLDKSTRNANGKSPLDVLLSRRPDLEYIKLTCENTNTLIPYVDLVNEILESYVALGKLDGTVAKDTADATAAELSANPQNTNDDAYEKLKNEAVYPFVLPYNQPLEVSRVYLEHLGSPRHQILQAFQNNSAPSDLDIACEYLRISPEERDVLIGASPIGAPPRTLADFYYVPNTPSTPQPSDLVGSLKKVPEFLKQTGISYVELIDLVKTQFLNPHQGTPLEITLDTPDSIPDPADPSKQRPVDACDLSHTTVNNLNEATLGKMHRFIRLWRKLGWTVQDLDRTLRALNASDIDGSFLLKLAHVKRLQADLNVNNIQILLSLWANIDTRGDDSLYRKLFLSKAVLRIDPEFQPKADGSVLTNAALKISDYIPVLLAALRVSATDLAAIRADAQLDADAAPLTLANISALYRYAALAHALRLRINDLIALKTVSGIDPFANPEQSLAFATVAHKMQQSGFGIVQLDYLYRHLTAPPADLAPQPTTVLLIAKALRDGLTKIAQDNVFEDDPMGERTRAKLALLFDSAIVDQTIAIINGAAIYSVPLATLPAAIAKNNSAHQVLGIDATKVASLIANKVSYDPKTETLSFTGAMTTAEQTALLGAAPDAAYQAAVNNLYQQPLTFIQNALTGFLEVKDAEKNLLRDAPSLDAVSTTIANKFAYLLKKLLPYLITQLSHALVKQTIADALKLDAALAQILLESVLKSVADNTKTAINDLLTLATMGLTAKYFTSNNLTGANTPGTDATVAFDGNKSKLPDNVQSASWDGLLLAPSNDDFTFAVRTNGNVQLWVGDGMQPLTLQLDATTNEMVSKPISLKATQLYELRLEVTQLPPNGVIELRWQSAQIAKAIIPSDNLYPAPKDDLTKTFTRLQKAALIVNASKLADKEIAYLSDHPKDFDGFDLNALPLIRDDATVKKIDQNAPALFKWWLRLSDYVTLRDALPHGEVSLIDVFSSASIDDAKLKLAQATGWDAQVITALSKGFTLTATDFQNEIGLTRLQGCVRLIKRIGASAQELFSWTNINADFKQLQDMAQDIKKTVKERYDEQTWLTVAKPLNDTLRESQRDSLVAYLLPRLGRSNSNQLFEYFLIDVDMSACMATSRIKQAISSVQLFVQRCLMNLEQRDDKDKPEWSVSPSAIDDQWEWMKQYRIWEANRKVFLYPENWIEPELRDDKTPFFKELEAELLQNDVTKDTAERAFLNYLEKLDQVARLDICGMYWQEDKDPETQDVMNILHVFGRTFHVPHIYYYRQFVNSTTWTPWEKVQVDIEGDHLIPVVWNRRLYLFWPVFKEGSKALDKDNGVKYWNVTIAWSEYKDKKWSPKQVSLEFIISAPTRVPKNQHTFKALITENNDLIIQTFLHWAGDHAPLIGEFQFHACHGNADVRYVHWYLTWNLEPNSFTLPKSKLYEGTFSFGVGLLGSSDSNVVENMTLRSGEDATALTLVSGPIGDALGSDDEVGSGGSLNAQLQPVTFFKVLPSSYRLLYPHQFRQFVLQAPFFYQDDVRTYFASPRETYDPVSVIADPTRISVQDFTRKTIRNPFYQSSGELTLADHSVELAHAGTAGPTTAMPAKPPFYDWSGVESKWHQNWKTPKTWVAKNVHVRFDVFFHPYVCEFIKGLKRKGIPGLLDLSNQELNDRGSSFYNYNPTLNVDSSPPNWPIELVDFSNGGPYSIYNWELFFHVPLLIATRLSKNKQFEHAITTWYPFIFNPTDDTPDEPSPARYWKVFPLKKTESQGIEDLLIALGGGDSDLQKQVEEWRIHPFQPHLLARLRPIAYQKNVVMKYIETLIARADELFNQDTIEFINEATQWYGLVVNILGPRPQRIPARGKVEPETYSTLRDKLDAFSNAMVTLENEFPFSSGLVSTGSNGSNTLLGIGKTLYFCTPQNDKLLGYWDTVDDRLFKIRHCMNIEGIVRELPLFEPPIDPALLVQATATGVDLNSVLRDMNAALPYYRFSYMLQKALELCGDVRALGTALLSAIEKKDAEELALLRATHEIQVLEAARQVKERQIEEAKDALEGLQESLKIADSRFQFYSTIPDRIEYENAQLDLLDNAQTFQAISQLIEVVRSAMAALPDVNIELGIPAMFGGTNLANMLDGVSKEFGFIASILTHQANRASILGGWARRSADWGLQAKLAQGEQKQISKQILAAQVRQAIAENELENHDLQIENAKAIDDYMRNKFTNQDLYDWMISQVSSVYFQAYQMAYDLAKRTEKAFRFERGLTTSNFIQFGYWDSLKKGLLAGERLQLALKQMEQAYLDQNKREYEITKHISLMLHAPLSLIALKETGQCEFELPETMFDADYPGHYMRRIKSVSLTIPCVVGPYTSINCTLTLLNNKTRIKSSPSNHYPEQEGGEDDRFVVNFAAMQSIATSHAQNDPGMFEISFRDERRLPCEGAGLISRWRIELPKETNGWDLNTVSDVVLHLKYTARDGGEILKNAATNAMQNAIGDADKAPLARMFSLKHEFPTDWYRFLHPTDITVTTQTLQLDLTKERFPFQFRSRPLQITQIEFFLNFKDDNDNRIYTTHGAPLQISLAKVIPGTPNTVLGGGPQPMDSAEALNGIPHTKIEDINEQVPVSVQLEVSEESVKQIATDLREQVPATGAGHQRLKADAIDDFVVVCHYSVVKTTVNDN